MPWYERLMNIDRRILYLTMFLGIAYVMFFPIGFPVPPEESTKAGWDFVNNIPVGSVVLYSFDTSASAMTETKPPSEVLVKRSIELGHKVVMISTVAEANSLSSLWMDPIIKETGAVYGEDIVHLGFMVSWASFMEQARTDLHGANGNIDKYGTPLSDIPMMKDITKAADFAFVFSFYGTDPGPNGWINMWNATEGIPVLCACTAVSTPNMMNYYQSGLLKGVVGGIAGAAYLEMLAGTPGFAVSAMDSQSIGHMIIIIFLILGNVSYLASRYYYRKESRAKLNSQIQ